MKVAVIGSGFGGLGMAIELARAGFHDFTIFEKADRLGGTWRDNTYPGAACDVPSHLYSFSFDPGTRWSRSFATQPEILAYLEGVAARHGVLAKIRFSTEIAAAELDEARATWRLTTTAGEVHEARVVIFACGQLNRPAQPDLPNRFAGPQLHSARWRSDVALDGKRVAVIGTGASAVQLVPPVAERAAKLTVFQRSPPWIVPKNDVVYSPGRRALGRVPGVGAAHRLLIYLAFEARFAAFRGRDGFFARLAERAARGHLHAQVRDPALRAALTPDYPVGCKRILISDDYYPAMTRPHVRLVTASVSALDETAIVAADGERHEVDVVIWATGFRSTEILAPIAVRGRGGRALADAWRDGPEAYLGITVSGFPNLFILYGPNTNLAHNSIVYMLESQFAYVISCLRALRDRGLATLEVRAERQRAHNAELATRLAQTVWNAGCTSWYRTPSGRIVNNWPGWTFAYRWLTQRMDPRDYELS